MSDSVVCASKQFKADNGVLGLSQSGVARLVVNSYKAATGDGAIDAALNGGGRTLVEHQAHWVSDYDVAVTAVVLVQRDNRSMQTVAPTQILVRERTTTAVGQDTQNLIAADTPGTDPNYDAEWAFGIDLGGIDLGALGAIRPFALSYASESPSLAFRAALLVLPGQSLDVRYRAAVTTNKYYLGQAGQNLVKASGVRLLVEALPGAL